MTSGAKTVLEAFDRLSVEERREVARELLRRSGLDPHEAPTDDELVQVADEAFLELERHESAG